MAYRIGISGWTYSPWRGKFYPEGLSQKRELEYAGRCFSTLEINGSFYSLQRPTSYRMWYDATPAGFVFAVKGGRYITHMLKLKGVDWAVANFFASGVLALKEKLGPILWQFPPFLPFDRERFEAFFAMLPTTTSEAARLSKQHTDKVSGRSCLRTDADRQIRYAIEVRHKSFMCNEFMDLLRKHNTALVFADTAGLFPYAEDLTADFVYARLHGAEELYSSGYSDKQLDWWAARLRKWHAGSQAADAKLIASKRPKKQRRDVYVYFDNDAKVHAPFDAARLAQRVGEPALHCPGEPLPELNRSTSLRADRSPRRSVSGFSR